MVKIAVDLDDVLTDSALRFIEFSNQTWGYSHTIEDYSEDWTTLWGVSHDQAQEMSKQWHDSDAYHAGVPNEEAVAVLRSLSRQHDLVIVTSRRDWARPGTLKWVEQHYPGIFDEVHFAGMWDYRSPDSVQITKAGTVMEVAADYLIDDQPKHCHAVAEAGPRAIVFGEYHWNQSVRDEIIRCRDWQEVAEYFSRYE